jgi:hypothetical protein
MLTAVDLDAEDAFQALRAFFGALAMEAHSTLPFTVWLQASSPVTGEKCSTTGAEAKNGPT